MFRPKRGLYSGVIVIFFDLNSAANAFSALRNTFVGNRKCVAYFVEANQLYTLVDAEYAFGDNLLYQCIENQGELLIGGLLQRDDHSLAVSISVLHMANEDWSLIELL